MGDGDHQLHEEEEFDILTKTGLKTGFSKPRSAVHRDGDYHRAVHVWIFAESTQQLLLQKRADCKDSWPGLWDISSAGHVSAGDTSLITARRELQEELGVTLPNDAFELLFVFLQECVTNKGKFIDNEFDDVYLVTTLDPIPLEAFTLQESEVSAVKYISVEEYKHLLANGDPHYAPYNVDGPYGQLFDIITKRYQENAKSKSLLLQQKLARYAPISLTAELTGLSEEDKEVLALLIQAAKIMDDIFYKQVWYSNASLRGWLNGRGEISELDMLKWKYYSINKSPWSCLDENEAFLTTADSVVRLLPEATKQVAGWKGVEYKAAFPILKPPGASFYPPDMDKMEFEIWMKGLSENEKQEATGFFNVIKRQNDAHSNSTSDLSIVPYSQEYSAYLTKAAELLRKAGDLTSSPSLKRLLHSKADAFLSNDYYDSDIAWMELDSKLDVTIGPYETYEDVLFGYKTVDTMDSFFPAQLKAKLEEGSSSQQNDACPETQESENGSGMDIFSQQLNLLMYIIDYYNKQVNRPPLLAPVLCLRFYLSFGIKINEDHPLRIANNDEFVEMIEMVTKGDENFDKDVLKKAPLIQNDLINSCSVETTKAIVNDICGGPNGYFAILVDEYEDDVGDEHIVVCLRYVDKKGDVVEKFLGISRVMDHKKDVSLKDALSSLLLKNSLSLSNVRGQSYNGVRKMYYDVSGLKTLIKNDTQSAYYVHCFAQQLEPILVAVSQQNDDCGMFFYILEKLITLVGVCWKESEVSTESRFQKLAQVFEDIEVEIREGSDEKVSCGPHYKSVLKVIDSYDKILDMLDMMANVILRQAIHHSYLSTVDREIFSFRFVFMLYLMKTLLGASSEVNTALLKKDQDIVNAMSLVKSVKEQLQIIRNEGWESLLASVVSFCEQNDVNVPNMEDMHLPRLTRRNREPEPTTTTLHHFQVDVFYSIIDKQLQELNERFDEESMELLVCMACLSPAKSFSSFDKKKLLKLAEFYPNEFSTADLLHLSDQLDKYIQDVKKDKRFKGLKDIKELSKKLVQVKKHEVFNLVYLLIKLVLILPVVTACVQRGLWRMAFVEKELKSNTGGQLLNDRMVTYIERDVFITVSNEDIINNFESKKTRRE